MRLLIPIFAALLLAACQTPRIEPVTATSASLLEINLANWQVAELGIERVTRTGSHGKQELWRWPTGGLIAARLPRDRYIRGPLTAEDLIEVSAQWPPLEEIDLNVEDSDVKRTANSLGEVVYAVANSGEADLMCFVMLQPLPLERTHGYQRPSGIVSGGMISGFDCVPEGAIDRYAYERRMLRLVHALE